MNIFAIHQDPWCAAQLPDKLVVKMPLETAQMLSTAVHSYYDYAVDTKSFELFYKHAHLSIWFAFWCRELAIYKTSFRNHPCTIWARQNKSNFLWLYKHGIALCFFYHIRYGRVHKCFNVLKKCKEYIDVIPDGSLEPFALAMPDQYKSDNATDSYRAYIQSKSYFPGYNKLGDIPDYFGV